MSSLVRTAAILVVCFPLTGCGKAEPAPASPPGVAVEDQTNIGVMPESGKKKK